jgi:hypothetical protein
MNIVPGDNLEGGGGVCCHYLTEVCGQQEMKETLLQNKELGINLVLWRNKGNVRKKSFKQNLQLQFPAEMSFILCCKMLLTLLWICFEI